MKTAKGKRLFSFLLALVVFFAAFILVYERWAYRRALNATERYGRFLALPLWNIDQVAGAEYAQLIMSTGRYSALALYHSDGDLFVLAHDPPEKTGLDEFLESAGLVTLVPFTANVIYQGKTIGRIEAAWINRNVYVYVYVAFVMVLVAGLGLLAKFFRTAAIQRERAEEALSESRERLRTVVAGAPIILFALNREGIFLLSEGKGLDKIRRAQGEMVGLSIYDLYGDRNGIHEDIRRALSGETFTAMREIEGTTFETWYSPLPSPDGEADRVIGVATDVTELQRVMAKLEARDKNMREELALAQRIQSAMLPDRIPEIQGLEIGMLFIPSGDIGGDFIEFIESPDRQKIGILFADITGHGVPAALLSAMFKVVIDDVLHACEGPAECFDVMNARLAREFPRGNFASAFLAEVDAAGRQITYVKAAQEPALLYRADGSLEKLAKGGPVLGVLTPELGDGVKYHEERLRFDRGDLLFLYTDGLVELENPAGEMLDPTRLDAWIREAFHLPPQELVEQVHQRAVEFTGTEVMPDDIAVLAIRMQ